MLLLSFLLPSERKIWPSKTNEQEVNLFKSSALAIFNVSLKNLLNTVNKNISIHKIDAKNKTLWVGLLGLSIAILSG